MFNLEAWLNLNIKNSKLVIEKEKYNKKNQTYAIYEKGRLSAFRELLTAFSAYQPPDGSREDVSSGQPADNGEKETKKESYPPRCDFLPDHHSED